MGFMQQILSHSDISLKVEEAWRNIDEGFPGQRFKGMAYFDTDSSLMVVPQLNSHVYTEIISSRCCIPQMPAPYDGCTNHAVPEGMKFRAEIAVSPDNQEKFLAILFEGTGTTGFNAFVLTNDPDYVATHNSYHWRETQSKLVTF